MNQILTLLSDIRFIIAVGAIFILLLIILIVTTVRARRYKSEYIELENRYQSIKQIPLSLKMNKAIAVSRVNQDTVDRVNSAQNKFDEVQSCISALASKLTDLERYISAGTLSKAGNAIKDIETSMTTTEADAKTLENMLDAILAKETAQREEVTTLKNRFRALKAQAAENAPKLYFAWPLVEQKVVDTEKMFATFEEWMFSSDFDKANRELVSIKAVMTELEEMIENMPSLLEDAKGVIPNMAEVLHKDYIHNRNRGVYLKHLNVEENLNQMTESLRESLKQLKTGSTLGVRETLDTMKAELREMDQAVKQEGESFDAIQELSKESTALADEADKNAAYVKEAFAKSSSRFGFADLEEKLAEQIARLQALEAKMPAVMDSVRNYQVPASTVVGSLKELNEEIVACNTEFKNIRTRIEAASGDEERCKKQLVKLQIVMNQMQVKIRKYKLPNISEAYEDDMRRANDYIHRLDNLMEEVPLNMQLLNGTLQEALDFIYKLYNNVNNVVGTVMMVENTIVFGNRYRSTYADIDSELTRSELSFRNGEYTQALTTAIATIEKIHPGNYESMIKENAKSAA